MDDGETHENAHQYVSSPLQVVVTKCEDPLRQFHHSKDGVLVTSTCNASEWCMTHVESHGTHDHPHLDQSWTNQHPNGHWSALCERKRRNSTVNVVRCNNPILILQGGAEIIPQRIAPEWCVVALTTTCSTSPCRSMDTTCTCSSKRQRVYRKMINGPLCSAEQPARNNCSTQ